MGGLPLRHEFHSFLMYPFNASVTFLGDKFEKPVGFLGTLDHTFYFWCFRPIV